MIIGFGKIGMCDDVYVKPSIGLSERYETNPRISSGQTGSGDFSTSISPQVAVTGGDRGLQINGSYRLRFNLYHSDQDLNNINHDGNVAIFSPISARTSIAISDSLRLTNNSIDSDDSGIQTGRSDIMSNTALVGFKSSLTQVDSTSFSISDTVIEYDDPRLFDLRTDTAALSINHIWSTLVSTNLGYRFSRIAYDTGRDFDTHSVKIGLTERLSSVWAFSLDGGINYTEWMHSNYNWSANTGITGQFSRSSVRVGFGRSITHSSGISDEININNTASASWNYFLSRPFAINAAGSYSKNTSEPSRRVEQSSYTVSLGASWQANEWMRIGAGISHFQQWRSGLIAGDIQRETASLNMTITPQGWRF